MTSIRNSAWERLRNWLRPERRKNTRNQCSPTTLSHWPLKPWDPSTLRGTLFLPTWVVFYAKINAGDPREASFLFQRLSLVIQRFNAIAFHGTFVTPDLENDGHSKVHTFLINV